MKRFVHWLAGACLALAGCPALSAWIVHDLGSPNDRVTDIRVAAVNDRGEVTGGITMTGDTAVPARAAFVLDRNGFHLFGESLDTPPTVPKDINRSGTVVGNDALPFIYDDEKVRIPGLVPHASANAINDRGVVVGGMQSGPGALHAFQYADGVLTDLGTIGGPDSQAFGINRRGDIVGSSTLFADGRPKAFVAAIPELAAAGFTSWIVHGELVGASYGEGPGIAINNHGQVVGAGMKDGKPRLFLLTPRGRRD